MEGRARSETGLLQVAGGVRKWDAVSATLDGAFLRAFSAAQRTSAAVGLN